MDNFQRFTQLAATARGEDVPSLDVTERVMERITPIDISADGPNRVLAVCGIVSALAAGLAVAVTVWAWSAWADPLSQLFTQTATVIQ